MGEFNISTLILFIGVIIICFTVFRATRRRRDYGPVTLSSPGRVDPAPAKESIDKLLVEIQEISREQIAQLDTRIRIIRQLTADLDAKQREIERILSTASALPAKGPPSPPPRPLNPLHEKVYQAVDGGKSLDEVCAATGMGRGEVELILGLRKIGHD